MTFRRSVVLFAAVALVMAGCASGVLDVSWSAPKTNADGSPRTDTTSYVV